MIPGDLPVRLGKQEADFGAGQGWRKPRDLT
jgi:hypothetical protein